MKPEIKKIWIEALRSGKYQQGQGALKEGDSFCCLGVLCDLYDSTGWDPAPNDNRSKKLSFQSFMGAPSLDVLDWSKFPQALLQDYIDANDIHDLTFHQIADMIEEKL